jgi:mRNA interferase RelE/StbE
MSRAISFLPEAEAEFGQLDGSVRLQISKGIMKLATNPLPRAEGGYGVSLRNSGNSKLAGCCKIKFKGIGQRVVYCLQREGKKMTIIVIGIRDDASVYREAHKRRQRYGL